MNAKEIMALVWACADATSIHRLESLYGTSKAYTLQKAKERDGVSQTLRASIEQLVNERDELLQSLQEIYQQCNGYVPDTSKSSWAKVYSAIVKATGQPPVIDSLDD